MLGLLSFSLAALAYCVLGALILVKGTPSRTGKLFVVAIGLQTLWAIAFASAYTQVSTPVWLLSATEAARTFGWTLFLLSFVSDALKIRNSLIPENTLAALQKVLRGTQLAIIAATAVATASVVLDVVQSRGIAIGTANFGAKLIAAVLGIWCVEQIYRNIPVSQRWAIKFLCVALAALFGFDLVLYAEALLFERVNYAWMTARGFANAVLVPLLAIAAVRNRGWQVDIMVSRQIVFHSATLLASGVFLIFMSTVGSYVRYFGGQWGEVAQAVIFFMGVIGLLVVVLSGQLRARLRVFLAKNFFSYRYDYRDEWLALTKAIGAQPDDKKSAQQALSTRAIEALSRLVESNEGRIWLKNSDNSYETAGRLQLETQGMPIAAHEPLIGFMQSKEWVVVIPEMESRKDLYDGLVLPQAISAEPRCWLVIPLLLRDELIGIVTLHRPTTPITVDWEVRDVLKAGARQVASYLGLQRAVEQLVVARQFESFNRMSAFVVHDLKNLVAQLGLLLGNAKRHKDNPEFQADMLSTVENVMDRMQGLLLQLRAGTKPIEQAKPVLIREAIASAVDSKKALAPKPTVVFDDAAQSVYVTAHEDRLARVIGHLLQNAAEATGPQGTISVQSKIDGAFASIEVKDNGKGMTEDFMRSQLFKPFETTKAHGMGIGTFESKEYIAELGGELKVTSEVGHGTSFFIRLPVKQYV